MRPPRVAVWFAIAGALMAILFLALGHVSPEPLDHPQWLMAGSWPVLVCYKVLVGFCLPVLCLYGILLYALGICGLASHDFYNPLGQMSVVVYPLMQGIIYGGAAWMIVLLGNVVHDRLLRWRKSRDSSTGLGSVAEEDSENGPNSSQTRPQASESSCWMTGRKVLAVTALVFIPYSIVSVLVLLPSLPSTWTVDFDRTRYAEIHEAIKADEHHLLGKSFDEVSKRFGLEGVPWDDAGCQRPPNSDRIYHFRGFAFHVTVDWELPEDSPLRARGSYTTEELRRYGVLRLAHQWPFVRADGINDPKERMKRHWDAIEEECRRINVRMERERQRMGR